MARPLDRLQHALFKDYLLVRVTLCIIGAGFLVIPLLALGFDVLNSSADPALKILMALFFVFGSSFVCIGTRGSERFMERAVYWAFPTEILVALALITFAIPITLLIRYFRKR